jgi:hypothetical protein
VSNPEAVTVARELYSRLGWRGANEHVGRIIRRLRKREPMTGPNVQRWHAVLVELEAIWVKEEWK